MSTRYIEALFPGGRLAVRVEDGSAVWALVAGRFARSGRLPWWLARCITPNVSTSVAP